MSSTFSALKFELITTGEQSGSWGGTTNINIGTAIEQAIVGMATLTSADFSTNVATLTLTNTNTAQNARALCIVISSGCLAAAGVLNVPAIQKPYIIINNDSFAITVKVSGLTGVSVPAGKRTVVYNNGTDLGNQIDYLSSLTLGTALPVTSGGTGTTTPALVAGNNITLAGSWPNQTITAAGPTVNIQTFNSTAVWTKPTTGQTMARIQLWGGGGGGGRTDGATYQGINCGGGGGGYNELTVPLSYLASSVTVFVGAGGAGATTGGAGGNGGDSYILLSTAYNGLTLWFAGGGAGGWGNTVSTPTGGGAGGGPLGPGSTIYGGLPRFFTGFNITLAPSGGGTLAAQYAGDIGNPVPAFYHGGGGFPSQGNSLGTNVTYTQNSTTGSYWGGGGGSMTNSAGTVFTGGVSLYGGSGGTNSAGSAPGGGGSSYYTLSTNGNAGAAGRVVITSF
jgi:hypothetical protein